MASLSEYFSKNRYQPKYEFMARVTGVHKGVRWIGCVGNDTVVNEEQGPVLKIILDLPLKVDGKYTTVLVVKHKDVKRLKIYD